MNFQKLTAILGCLIVALTAGAAGKKISDYTETLILGDGWMYEIAVPGVTNYKVTFGTMATNIMARVPVGGVAGVTNVISLSTSNATSKPITNAHGTGVLTVFGIEAGANVTVTPNGSNLVIVATGGGSLAAPFSSVQFNSNGVAQGSSSVLLTNRGLMLTSITSHASSPIILTPASGQRVKVYSDQEIYSTTIPGAVGAEGALVFKGYDSTSAEAKIAAIAGRWTSPTSNEHRGQLLLHATKKVAGVETDDEIVMFAGDGIGFYPISGTVGPGVNIVDVNGGFQAGTLRIGTPATSTYFESFVPATSGLGDFSSGVIGIKFARSVGGPRDHAMYSYISTDLGHRNLAFNADNDMVFSAGNGVGADLERVRISYQGNVGIGNAAPTVPLDVFGAAATTVKFVRDLATDAGVSLGADNTGAQITTIGIHELQFLLNGTRRITFDSSGNVAIGTNSAFAKLHVVADNSTLKGFRYGTTNRPDLVWFDTNGVVGVASNLWVTGAVAMLIGGPAAGQVPTFRSDGTLYPSNVVATASGTNFPPVTTTGTNIVVGTGVRKSLLVPTNASVGISFNGTEILGENITIVVTNTSAAASNITINFFQDGSASSYFDAMVASNVTGFLVVSNSSKRMEFVYNGTFWRLESTLAKEMELSIAGGLSLHTNSVTSIVTLSNSLAIQQLNNVGVGTPANGDILSWNAAMGRWTNGVVPGGDVISNITVSATNNVLLDFGAANIFKLTLLTNWTETFTNVTLLTKKGYVYYQQDTNGGRLLNNYYVNGGLLQTNATENMQPTTNASALDLLEIMPGFFVTNLIAYWPQDFQPRIKFTNSLHAFASFLDTFNRSNADPMSTTASDGNTWTSGPGALGEPRIVSAMLFGNAGATGCRVLTPTLSGNQRANLTLLNDIGHIGPMVRIQSASVASGYMLVADDATHLAIYKITDTGTLANVVLFTSTATPPMVPGDILTLSVNGTTLEAFLNGVSYGSVVDATFSGGQPGIWADTDTASGGPFTASEQ